MLLRMSGLHTVDEDFYIDVPTHAPGVTCYVQALLTVCAQETKNEMDKQTTKLLEDVLPRQKRLDKTKRLPGLSHAYTRQCPECNNLYMYHDVRTSCVAVIMQYVGWVFGGFCQSWPHVRILTACTRT